MITVLLAVFNGEKYLREQIDSIINQTVSDVRIVIRDDGSSDSSNEIIDEYAKKFPERISVIFGAPTGGAASNFAEMLKVTDDDYIMFADQDDVWFENKVQNTFDAMLKLEGGNIDTPVLVHTDLTVTDDKLNIISDSFFKYQKIYPDDLSLNRLLVQNYVTGCTVMINRALKNRALPMPDGVAMHDWWLALSAAAFGKISTVFEPTMYYRQHENNEVGAKAGGGIGFLIRKLKTLGKVRQNVAATYRQAKLLNDSYGEMLSDENKKILLAFIKMENASRIEKIRTINRFNLKKGTRLRVLGQYFID